MRTAGLALAICGALVIYMVLHAPGAASGSPASSGSAGSSPATSGGGGGASSAPADSGTHSALSADGRTYQVASSYAGMSPQQQDDANRFARQYPNGTAG